MFFDRQVFLSFRVLPDGAFPYRSGYETVDCLIQKNSYRFTGKGPLGLIIEMRPYKWGHGRREFLEALFVFIREGNIRYDLAIPLAVTSMIGSYAGAHTALKLGDRWLKGLLAAFVAALVIKLIR